jgi:transposase
MSAPIPQKIRQKVVEYYFTTPKSMDWIAQKCGITKSSVFNMVHAKMTEDPDFTLMRYLVVNLEKRGTDVPQYATGIRIQQLLEEYGVDYGRDTKYVL